MNTDEIVTAALELVRQGRLHITAGESAHDPVWQRRHLARAAAKFRSAADLLDDHGNLDPDWEAGGL